MSGIFNTDTSNLDPVPSSGERLEWCY